VPVVSYFWQDSDKQADYPTKRAPALYKGLSQGIPSRTAVSATPD